VANPLGTLSDHPCAVVVRRYGTSQESSLPTTPDEILLELFKEVIAKSSLQEAARTVVSLNQVCWRLHRIFHDHVVRAVVVSAREERALAKLWQTLYLETPPSPENIRARLPGLMRQEGRTELSLPNCVAIPPEMGCFVNLRTLYLDTPNLEFSPHNFSRLSFLHTLKFYSFKTPRPQVYIAPHTFSKMHQLTALSLATLRIRACDARTFHGLSQLQQLDLSSALIHSSNPHLFDPLDQLQCLDLCNTKIDLETIALPISLQKVKINPFSTPPNPRHFAGLTNLQTLELNATFPLFLTLGVEVQDMSVPTTIARWNACRKGRQHESELARLYQSVVVNQCMPQAPPLLKCAEDCKLLHQMYWEVIAQDPKITQEQLADPQYKERRLQNLYSYQNVANLGQAIMNTVLAKYDGLSQERRAEIDTELYVLAQADGGAAADAPASARHRFDNVYRLIDAVVRVAARERALS